MATVQMINTPPSISSVIRSMDAKGYKVFKGANKDLNIVGIRNTDDLNANTFNDWMCLFWMNTEGDCFEGQVFSCTTDPGQYWRENPMNVNGTAILTTGQIRGAFKIGTHKGYRALQQNKPFTVYRDRDGNGNLDMSDTEVGMFGINLHRAGDNSRLVNKWSAGCQVIQDNLAFDYIMNLCTESSKTYGPVFTYTLLESKDLDNG